MAGCGETPQAGQRRFTSRILLGMNTTEILSAIDGEIARLGQVRSLLIELNTTGSSAERAEPSTSPRRGRPKGSKNKATSFNPSEFGLRNDGP